MSGTSSVPQPVWTDAGYVIPAEPDILAGTAADIDAAFGGGLNAALETPQGQLASSDAAIIANRNDQFLALTQGVDPAYASGRMQDGIARIYFIERNPAEPTTHPAVACGGLPGTPIPTGALVRAMDGNLYSCTAGGTIDSAGTVALPFACTTNGPIPLPANSLSLYQVVPGWDSVDNPTDGVIGTNVESRAQFETRRQQSVALNSRGPLSAIQAAVVAVPGVLDAYTAENTTGSPITLDGVTVPAKSIFVCVSGGDPQLVAQAIQSKKAPGCGYSGNTTETVYDTTSGYLPPYPSYSVSFQTATPQTFVVVVTLSSSAAIPANAASLVAAAVLAAFAGADGGSRARIGSRVLTSRYYAGVAALGPWAQVVEILIGSSASPAASINASVSGSVLNVGSVSSGSLAPGQFIQGVGIADGVRITSNGTGTGGTGTYNLSVTMGTVTARAMIAVAANLTAITVGQAHVPVLSTANVVTALG